MGRCLCVKLLRPQLCSHLLGCLPGLPPACSHFTPISQPLLFLSPALMHTLHLCPPRPLCNPLLAPIIALVAKNGDMQAADFQTEMPFSSLYAWSLFPHRHLLFFNRSATLFMSLLQLILHFKCHFICYHDGRLCRFIFFSCFLFCFFRKTPLSLQYCKFYFLVQTANE